MTKKLWQHSYAQPKMTLEEHSELEYVLMKDKQKKMKRQMDEKNRQLKKLGIEDEDDSENEMVSEAKTYKDRRWDNWKDENEKGSGNTMSR